MGLHGSDSRPNDLALVLPSKSNKTLLCSNMGEPGLFHRRLSRMKMVIQEDVNARSTEGNIGGRRCLEVWGRMYFNNSNLHPSMVTN